MIIQIEDFLNINSKKSKKTQIVLCNTLRPYRDYINSLKYRCNGKYDRIPHFVIGKTGDVYCLMDTKLYSNFLAGKNKNKIVICLENLGWLQKNTLISTYHNWIGDIYRGTPIENKWRDRFFWDPYDTDQMNSLITLVKELCFKHKIKKEFSGHLAMINNATKIEGILTRSNYSDIYTDISPAFDINYFKKNLENEKSEETSERIRSRKEDVEYREKGSD